MKSYNIAMGVYRTNMRKAHYYKGRKHHYDVWAHRYTIYGRRAKKAAHHARLRRAYYLRLRARYMKIATHYMVRSHQQRKLRAHYLGLARGAMIMRASYLAKMHAQKRYAAAAWRAYHHAKRNVHIYARRYSHYLALYRRYVAHYRIFVHRRNVANAVYRKWSIHLRNTRRHFKIVEIRARKYHNRWVHATVRASKIRMHRRYVIQMRHVRYYHKLIRIQSAKLRRQKHILRVWTHRMIVFKHKSEKMRRLRIIAQRREAHARKMMMHAYHRNRRETHKAKVAVRLMHSAIRRMHHAERRAKAMLRYRVAVERRAAVWHRKSVHARALYMRWHGIAMAKLRLLKKWRAAYIRANRMYRQMSHSMALWWRRMRHALKLRNRARHVAHYRRRQMANARRHMTGAIAARARAEARLRLAIKLRIHWANKAKHALVAMRAAKHLMNAAYHRRRRAHAHWLRERRQRYINWSRYVKAKHAYAIALREARKRMIKQAIYLRKWMRTWMYRRIHILRVQKRAIIRATAAYQLYLRTRKYRIRVHRHQILATARFMAHWRRQVAIWNARALAAKKHARRWNMKMHISMTHMKHMTRLRAIAYRAYIHERKVQHMLLMRARAVRRAVFDYIMKVRLLHARRNYLFDRRQCHMKREKLNALWGKHNVHYRRRAQARSHAAWCRAMKYRAVQVRYIHYVMRGAHKMNVVHHYRKLAFNLESYARHWHNYVWSPRIENCKGRCIKYKDWLKIVTALAKAMAMKPCGKIPNAPVNGVKYVTHTKTVKVVNGNKMVLTHHITYHVCTNGKNCKKVKRTVTKTKKIPARPKKAKA